MQIQHDIQNLCIRWFTITRDLLHIKPDLGIEIIMLN